MLSKILGISAILISTTVANAEDFKIGEEVYVSMYSAICTIDSFDASKNGAYNTCYEYVDEQCQKVQEYTGVSEFDKLTDLPALPEAKPGDVLLSWGSNTFIAQGFATYKDGYGFWEPLARMSDGCTTTLENFYPPVMQMQNFPAFGPHPDDAVVYHDDKPGTLLPPQYATAYGYIRDADNVKGDEIKSLPPASSIPIYDIHYKLYDGTISSLEFLYYHEEAPADIDDYAPKLGDIAIDAQAQIFVIEHMLWNGCRPSQKHLSTLCKQYDYSRAMIERLPGQWIDPNDITLINDTSSNSLSVSKGDFIEDGKVKSAPTLPGPNAEKIAAIRNYQDHELPYDLPFTQQIEELRENLERMDFVITESHRKFIVFQCVPVYEGYPYAPAIDKICAPDPKLGLPPIDIFAVEIQ